MKRIKSLMTVSRKGDQMTIVRYNVKSVWEYLQVEPIKDHVDIVTVFDDGTVYQSLGGKPTQRDLILKSKGNDFHEFLRDSFTKTWRVKVGEHGVWVRVHGLLMHLPFEMPYLSLSMFFNTLLFGGIRG